MYDIKKVRDDLKKMYDETINPEDSAVLLEAIFLIDCLMEVVKTFKKSSLLTR